MEARNTRFDEIHKELNSRRLNTKDHVRVLLEMIPDPEERHAFSQYHFKKKRKKLDRT